MPLPYDPHITTDELISGFGLNSMPTPSPLRNTTSRHTKWRLRWTQSVTSDNLIAFMRDYGGENVPLMAMLGYLKAHQEILNDVSHIFWRYLYSKSRNLRSHSHKRTSLLDILFFYTGVRFCKVESILAPRKFFRSYENQESTVWYRKSDRPPPLVWCSITKTWWHKDYIERIYKLNSKKKLIVYKYHGLKEDVRIKDLEAFHYEVCPQCMKFWVKGYQKYCPELEVSSCPKCTPDDKTKYLNPLPTPGKVLQGYHATSKNWKFYIQRHNKKDDSLPMGIELEMHLKNNQLSERIPACYRIFKESQTLFPETNNFFFETDGSLGDAGVEMITNPMTLKTHQQYWPKLMPTIRKHFAGWYSNKFGGGSNNYGIHITVNQKYWSKINIARLSSFISSNKNFPFVMAIAQRTSQYGGWNLAASEGKLKDQLCLRPVLDNSLRPTGKKTLRSTDRYRPVHLKNDKGHMELRMFASTLNTGSFLKNLEFVTAFWNWSKETSYNIDYGHFITWLNTQSERLYPNLLEYLRHDQYSVKNLGVIDSKWKGQIKPSLFSQIALFPNPLRAPTTLDDEDRDIK
jgi:hypothetical protein